MTNKEKLKKCNSYITCSTCQCSLSEYCNYDKQELYFELLYISSRISYDYLIYSKTLIENKISKLFE